MIIVFRFFFEIYFQNPLDNDIMRNMDFSPTVKFEKLNDCTGVQT